MTVIAIILIIGLQVGWNLSVSFTSYDGYCYYTHYWITGWLESLGSRVVYELDYRKSVLCVSIIEITLGKLQAVPISGKRIRRFR